MNEYDTKLSGKYLNKLIIIMTNHPKNFKFLPKSQFLGVHFWSRKSRPQKSRPEVPASQKSGSGLGTGTEKGRDSRPGPGPVPVPANPNRNQFYIILNEGCIL